jgi:aspartate racemase
MKKIGLIGGIGPESTVDYYKRIIRIFREQYAHVAYPEIILFSANLNELLAIVESKDWKALTDWLLDRVKALSRAGADFAAIGSNTPHVVFDDVQLRSPIPLLSIVEETAKRAEQMGLKKLGLMGTKFTMESDFYQKVFRPRGMSVVLPDGDAQTFIQEKLDSEIELGILKDPTRQNLLAIVMQMIEDDSIEGLILGCTELPLILTKDEFGIPFLNTTAIHVESIIRYCLSD